jgi:hypothetical protein
VSHIVLAACSTVIKLKMKIKINYLHLVVQLVMLWHQVCELPNGTACVRACLTPMQPMPPLPWLVNQPFPAACMQGGYAEGLAAALFPFEDFARDTCHLHQPSRLLNYGYQPPEEEQTWFKQQQDVMDAAGSTPEAAASARQSLNDRLTPEMNALVQKVAECIK